jgi:stage II sporulation protein D
MITSEPQLKVGVLEHYPEVRGQLSGIFLDEQGAARKGNFVCTASGGELHLLFPEDHTALRAPEIMLTPADPDCTFLLHDVTIGVQFHWERKETQSFRGGLRFCTRWGNTLTAINSVPLEEYLKSVISSEMSATAPAALLKAHAITSRSWLVAMLERAAEAGHTPHAATPINENTTDVVRWYTREDHDLYDVCADDHCQRYQGITKIISPSVASAVEETRGRFLVYNGRVCDARFYKACGGLTEVFGNCWEGVDVPYLQTISDAPATFAHIHSEEQMRAWVTSSPAAFCNTTDASILRQILPSFDQETTDFFRWKVVYTREELEALLLRKSGIRFGTLRELAPVERGPSGRLVRLRIEGSERTITVGKELEIRRWLSPSHLYSSAFVVDTERDASGVPQRFTLTGAGWGHGVGLCQIGAAVMAVKGYCPEDIVRHYFTGADVARLY